MVPEKLRDLDAQRYDIIRKAVAAQEESEKHLTKEQVVTLVEWKLYVVPLNRDNMCGFFGLMARQEARHVSSSLTRPGPKQHARGS